MADAKPLLDNLEDRLRAVVFENVDRFHGAQLEIKHPALKDPITLTLHLTPVAPPSVRG